ncbi:hypothetical protein GAR05_06148 [Micromonospora saelicesensis]|uniref:Uncharacterized protein n=1 Tax=Micromonospora saelicesensis TaxID=285676 RepID=A0ABX9CAY7_9ACTN|nr:hypothetical protein [Micromonospora saelicesensis]RAN92656.1 hypothetical protein GAR05_06148 [Micromonospora saelicesensis]
MGAVRKYHVTHNGHKTILRLNEQDVKAYPDAQLVGGAAVEPEPEVKPAAKTRTPADKTRRPAGDK